MQSLNSIMISGKWSLKDWGWIPEELDFVFGRPLTDTMPLFGLKVMEEEDGRFYLTISDSD